MSKKRSAWSVQTVNTKEGEFAIVKGKAYPKIVPGKNVTRQVKANLANRREVYHDPAITLSQEDMESINGAQGAPLCFEHKRDDVVGQVHHSWIGPDGKCLQISAKIPLNTRGKEIVDGIRTGRIKGFSVGYGAEVNCEATKDGKSETTNLTSKTFHEISLVERPFFEVSSLFVCVFFCVTWLGL